MVTAYCGSLFVGHCIAEDLTHHFYAFIEKLSLSTSYLLNLGMDGPKVNLKFQNDLKSMLTNNRTIGFMFIGTCPLHSANNAFKVFLKTLKVADLDQFAIDIRFLFKHSAPR